MNVLFLPAAEQDLVALFAYISDELQNPAAARNIATRLLQRAQMLKNFPQLGASLAAIDTTLSQHRYLVVDNYLLIYRSTKTEVRVVRVLYARSDYVQLLQG